ncbi:MAG: Sua5/YciO/YrdC/YwlC family protein, partial [Minisyncoccia bacterium]
AVARVYTLKGRTPAKPCIILISSLGDLAEFGISLTPEREKILSEYWPGPVSIAMKCGTDVPEYLHRGTHTLVFRLPSDDRLVDLLKKAGPLIAPSANPEGQPPAATIDEAKKYFGGNVDFYVDGGILDGAPSTLVSSDEQNTIAVLRKGR